MTARIADPALEPPITLEDRDLIIPDELRIIGVAHDNWAEKVHFEFPTSFDENSWQGKLIYIDFMNAGGESDTQPILESTIEDGVLKFAWEIDNRFTRYNGTARFAVRITSSDGYRFGTKISAVEISEGIYVESEIDEEVPSRLEQWEAQLVKKIDTTATLIDEVSALKTDVERISAQATTAVNQAKTMMDSLTDGEITSTEGAKLATRVSALEDWKDSHISEIFNFSQKTGKLYQTKIWKFEANQTSQCIKLGANAGMVAEPSTDTVKGRDDYMDSGELLFKWWNCNYVREDDGFAKVTALESDPEYTETGEVDVGVLSPTFYYSYLDRGDHYLLTVSDSPNDEYELQPFEEAVREDGTVEPYFIMSKYFSGEVNGKLRSQPGICPKTYTISYQGMIAEYAKKGIGYHGAGLSRSVYEDIWRLIKYAHKSSQKVFTGRVGASFQYPASIKRTTNDIFFPLTTAQAADFEVGDCVVVGYPSTLSGAIANIDRRIATMHAYVTSAPITKKVDLGEGNVALYLDGVTPFPTADKEPIGGTVDAHVYISSMAQLNGSTDYVIGKYDGSRRSNTNLRNAYRIKGVEFGVGYYFTPSDGVINLLKDGSREFYACKRWDTRQTSAATITANYEKIGNFPASTTTNVYDDVWIGDIVIKDGYKYPASVGTSETLGVGDRFYKGGNNTGFRQFLLAGDLMSGGNAGSSCLYCGHGLGDGAWRISSAD